MKLRKQLCEVGGTLAAWVILMVGDGGVRWGWEVVWGEVRLGWAWVLISVSVLYFPKQAWHVGLWFVFEGLWLLFCSSLRARSPPFFQYLQ